MELSTTNPIRGVELGIGRIGSGNSESNKKKAVLINNALR